MLACSIMIAYNTESQAKLKNCATTVCKLKASVYARKGPGTKYKKAFVLKKGKKVTKIGVNGKWSALKYQGKIYYVMNYRLKRLYSYLYVARTDTVNLRSGPGNNYKIRYVVPINTRLRHYTTDSHGWRKIYYNKQYLYVYKTYTSAKQSDPATVLAYTQPKTTTETTTGLTQKNNYIGKGTEAQIRQKIIDTVMTRLGDKYSQKYRNKRGYCDCSSMVRDTFRTVTGIMVGENTTAQILTLGSYQRDMSKVQPGDIMMHIEKGANHAAIYLGDGKYIHASQSKGKVLIATYNPKSSYKWTCCYNAVKYCMDQK